MSTPITFSVVIPLYNGRDKVRKAVEGALAQTVPPLEVIVADDGSTDGGAGEFADSRVRVIRQANAGVSAARNRGVAEAKGEYIAFLDADDWWEPGFLAEIAGMIDAYPGCGIYCTGYRIHRPNGTFENDRSIMQRGVIDHYFRVAFSANVCWTSACVIPRRVCIGVGGFPEGMRRGQDLYMWTKVALRYPVCYSPARLSNYNLVGGGNSRKGYRLEAREYSFMALRREGDDDLDEYLARYEIGLGILQSVNGYTARARKVERETAFTRRYRLGWWKLWTLNRLPAWLRGPALEIYKRAAWLISSRGRLD